MEGGGGKKRFNHKEHKGHKVKFRISNFFELSVSAVSFSFNVLNDWNVWNDSNPRNAVIFVPSW